MIHVDVDPAEIGKVRAADVPIVGDARRVMEQMIEAWGERDVARSVRRGSKPSGAGSRNIPSVTTRTRTGRSSRSSSSRSSTASPAATPSSWRGSASTRCGPASSGSSTEPRRWINSGGLGTMGFAVPAAIGAKAGHAR